MKRILIFIIALIFFSCPSAFAQDKVYKNLQPGDLVEAGVDWNPGVIVEGYKDTEWGYGEYRDSSAREERMPRPIEIPKFITETPLNLLQIKKWLERA